MQHVPQEPMTMKRIRILYLDDEGGRVLVKRLLGKKGRFDLTEIDSWEAFNVQLEHLDTYDLVLSECNVPGADGLQVLAAVRGRNPRIPVVFVTDTDSGEVAVEAMKHGASDYVLKVEKYIERLPIAIDAAIEKQQLREERGRTVAALREAEARFRAIFEHAGAGMMVIGWDGTILMMNRTVEELLGLDRNEVEGKCHWSDFLVIRDGKGVLRGGDELYGNGRIVPGKFESRWRHTDGSVRDVLVDLARIPGGGNFVCSIVDITERKQHEQERLKLSQAVEQAGESVMLTNHKGEIEYVNPAFTEITGYSADEALGKTISLLKSGEHSEAFYEEMWRTISAGGIWRHKVVNRRKDGQKYTALQTVSPIRDEHGNITHFVDIQQDITTQQTLQEQLRQSQKMEALGTLVGGIAHDFNNMLAGMTGNLYLARNRCKDRPDIEEKLKNIERLSFRAAEMIAQLLTFARKGIIRMEPLSLTHCVSEWLKLARISVPENIDLRWHISGSDLMVNGDITQLQQLMMNLLGNACDALAEVKRPVITIRLHVAEVSESLLAAHPHLGSRCAQLSVEDNGAGIPEEYMDKIFEPFFTTKVVGKGTGLGLAMVYGTAQSHRGVVEVDSELGKGTCFRLYLPLLEAGHDVRGGISNQGAEAGCGETILLADDEESVRQTCSDVLESLGYQVIVAANGQEAVDMFVARPSEVSLLILDIVMPELGGVEAAEKIRKLRADIPVIFATGYDREQIAEARDQLPGSLLLTKPFSVSELSRHIRAML